MGYRCKLVKTGKRRGRGGPHPAHCNRALARAVKRARGSKSKLRAAMKAYNRCRGV
jgi:hypothetical protein